MPIWLNIFFIFVFMLVGSVFSGTEMALVSLRSSQIERMEQEDERGAHVARVARDPNRFLSALQIGVTLAGFLSASFGASSMSPHIVPILITWGLSEGLASGLTMVVLTLLISYFSIVISELVPKRIALQQGEKIARAMVPIIDIFATLTSPIIWLIGKNTNLLVRLLGFDPNEVESEVSNDELRVLVSSNTRLSTDEREILADVFGAEQTIVAEVMRPRADVVFLDGTMSIPAAAAFVRDQPYSRYPVMGESFDDILGFVHVRDLLDIRDPNATTVSDVTRDIIQLPGTSRILPSMSLLRQKGIHLAVVIDEYGGTDGIVTLEDITEELVGDIHDEYDLPENNDSTTPNAFINGVLTVDGGMTLEDFQEVSGIRLNDGPYETVAGYMIARTGELGYEGQVLSDDGYDMEVTEVEGRRIQTIQIRRHEDNTEGNTENLEDSDNNATGMQGSAA
ncbi:hemolysin family protein [Alloscardovia criceti]|uniref:hemolysin family protein n=1 Tax=Alloscardovia criceti TaxID=356828 RepID=UPI0003622E18|nr:hemolysin family protein [Alloscardovia criceti]